MRTYYYYISVLFVLIAGCKDSGILLQTDESEPAPQQISDVKAVALPGEILLTYKLPADPNLLYVQANYEIRPGVMREAKSSIYVDTLRLDGFATAGDYDVQLLSVGKNGKQSEPITITVVPKTPPVSSVFNTTKLTETFGGANVSFDNESRANLAVFLLVDTSGIGDFAPASTFYTSAERGNFAVRGYPSEKRRFAVYLQDRWDNRSDTLEAELTPLFEEVIPKDTWRNLKLPTDTWQQAGDFMFEMLWNNQYDWSGFASSNASTLPQHFSIDLGMQVTMSRFKLHQFMASHVHFYNSSALKRFELYGSNAPNPDGSWESWELLGTFESYKPSGLPRGQIAPEDEQYAGVDGEDFEFEIPPPPVRYLRLRSLESYSSSGQIVISEMTLFGTVIK